MKCSQYLSYNSNKHSRPHSSAATSKKKILTRPLDRKQKHFLFWPSYIILHEKFVLSNVFSRIINDNPKKWLLDFHKILHNSLHKILSFPLRISSINMTKSAGIRSHLLKESLMENFIFCAAGIYNWEWLFLEIYFYHVTNLWCYFFMKSMFLCFMTLLIPFSRPIFEKFWKTIIWLSFIVLWAFEGRAFIFFFWLVNLDISDVSFTLLGIIHEQSRFDRDRYVSVRFSNIRPSKLTTTIFLSTELVTLYLRDSSTLKVQSCKLKKHW